MTENSVHIVDLVVNGEACRETVQSSQLAVHFLREQLALTGAHIGCDTGSCGACTVIIDGQPTKSCTVLAVQLDGTEVETVESLAGADGQLDPLQQAFHDHHALQCGYCTPGILISARVLLADNPNPTEHEIRRALKGNICRCTGYVNIVRAIAAAAEGST
jgi:aerobic carbon-monoxide dehydrogenase small subunit